MVRSDRKPVMGTALFCAVEGEPQAPSTPPEFFDTANLVWGDSSFSVPTTTSSQDSSSKESEVPSSPSPALPEAVKEDEVTTSPPASSGNTEEMEVLNIELSMLENQQAAFRMAAEADRVRLKLPKLAATRAAAPTKPCQQSLGSHL